MDEKKVGYGCPPEEYRYRKGQSGNPKGRPRKTPTPPTLAEINQKVLLENIEIALNGKVVEMPIYEAILRQSVMQMMTNGAANPKSVETFAKLLSYGEAVNDAVPEMDEASNEELAAYISGLLAQVTPNGTNKQ